MHESEMSRRHRGYPRSENKYALIVKAYLSKYLKFRRPIVLKHHLASLLTYHGHQSHAL